MNRGYDEQPPKKPPALSMKAAKKHIARNDVESARQVVGRIKRKTLENWITRIEYALGNLYIPAFKKEIIQALEEIVNNEIVNRNLAQF